MISNTGGIE